MVLSSSSLSLCLIVLSLLGSSLKEFISDTLFFVCLFFLAFLCAFSWSFHLSAEISYLFMELSAFFIRAFNMLMIVTFKSLSGSSEIWVISGLESVDHFIS